MLRFRIEARLTVEPGPEVAFDTVTEETGQYSVTQSSLGADARDPVNRPSNPNEP
jgi:hypothetical protein